MPERIAIVSDVHANLEALTAVMQDIARRRVKKIYCLGDLIGYGPDPNACIEVAMANFEFVIKGNHDEAISYKIPKRFKRLAAQAAFWTRKQIKPRRAPGYREQRKRWSYVKKMPRTRELGVWLMAHGSVESNLDYVHDAETALEVFEDMGESRLCFLGHTHVPGIFLLGERDEIHYVEPEDGKRYQLNGRKAIINVGSVGQPRDEDPRACWVLAREDGSFSFRRVPYEVERTADKIFRTRGLPNSLGERLFEGE
ncbi:MAG: metallophosphoesterase [Planctomycetota bacterium]|nr:MAG: metallophosphoesterase [Planctomycetota bacterium]